MQFSETYRSPSSNSRQQADASEYSEHCPFLGAMDAPDKALIFPSDTNNCYSGSFPVPISVIHQKNYCLVAQYGICPVYRQNNGDAPARETPSLKEPVADKVVPLVDVAVITKAAEVIEPAVNPVEDRVLWWEAETSSFDESDALFGSRKTSASAVGQAGMPQPLPWDAQPHPDFQTDLDLNPAPTKYYGAINFRRVLVIILLLVLIPVVWWLIANAPERSNFLRAGDTVQGTVVTLPTLMSTSDSVGGARVGSEGSEPAPTGVMSLGGAVDATTTPNVQATLSDLERVAATATALFANATAVTGCVVPSWWVAYTIEEGDTIESLAEARGITPELMIVANCVAQPDLVPGETLYLPPVAVISEDADPNTPTPTATATTRPTRAPIRPTTAPLQFPTPTVSVIIIATLPPTAPPSPVPPIDQPPANPTAIPTTEPTAPPEPTATPPEPPAPAPPTEEAGGSAPSPTDTAP